MQIKMFRLLILCIFFHKSVYSTETVKVEVECAKQCTCTDQHISDLPLMKWQQVPIDRETKQNESLTLNRVHDDDEGFLENNPFVTAAFCVFLEDSHHIRAEQFFPQIQALTILYGRDTANKTIEYELSDFSELLALDIQGYRNVDSPRDADVCLHHNALLHLQNLRYLNIEHVLLFPDPNTTVNQEPNIDEKHPPYDQLEQRRTELEQRRSRVNLIVVNADPAPVISYDEYTRNYDAMEAQPRSNITFALLSDEPRIIPYDQFKKQQNLISTFAHLSNLKFLRLYRCHLETVTWDMFKDLDSLQMLSLEGNDIVEIPKLAFCTISHLKTLILSANKLMHLDLESLAGLFELEHLDLSRNNFHHLSETTFAPLLMLKYLDLRHNPVETIYGNTFEVTNATETLYVGSTQPMNVHANAFKGLNSLQKLVINNLAVDTLDNNLLRGMPKLKYLEINGRVDNIDFDAFTDSLDLEVLILRNCSLRYVSVDAFFALFDLRVLDLSWNNLEFLPPGVFNQLDSLTELFLSHNRFVEMPGVLDRLQYVKMLRMDNNPWNCSCDMAVWRSLNWNKVKEQREVDVPCASRYDKVPCNPMLMDFYVLNANVMPRCATPVKFEGYSMLHVLNKKLRCKEKQKKGNNRTVWHTISESSTDGRKRAKINYENVEPEHKVNPENSKTSAKNTINESDDNVDNGLDDLSHFINSPASSYNERNQENINKLMN